MPLNWRNDEYIILSNFGGRMISDLEVKEKGPLRPLLSGRTVIFKEL